MEGKLQSISNQSFYSNELLTGISILSVLQHVNELEISKCILIEPLLNHRELRNALKDSRIIIRSIDELIIKKIVAFTNFNDRFQEALPLSINSIMLMANLGLLKINGNTLTFSGENFDFQEATLGKTMKERISASKKIAEILQKETSANLYLNLRVEL